MLTAAQLAAREGKLTASAVSCLMTGDETKMLRLWQELVGDPAFVPEDMRAIWPVRLGETTESLNAEWYTRKTGRKLTRQGDVVIHPDAEWAACTLDGWDDYYPAPFEAKHVGGREALATILARYQPQLHWQMTVTQTKQAVLSVIEGSSEPIVEVIPFDEAYGKELWRRAEAFMQCVWSLTPPVALGAVQAPVKAERTYDMKGSNSWAAEAATWLANHEAKKLAEGAEKALKALVPADAARCHGYGIQITRNRAGSLALREVT